MIGWLRRKLAPILEHEQLLLVSFSTVLVMTGQGVISPVFPLLSEKFGVGAGAIGLTLTTFGLARLILNVPMGIAADRYGRRLLLVSGPIIGAVGMIGSGFAGSLPELLAWRFVAGAGSAIYATGAQVFLADVSTPDTRARYLGTNQGALLLGSSVGPAIGGFTAEAWGIEAAFVIVGLCSLVAGGYAYWRLPETRHLSSEVRRVPVPGEAPRRRAWVEMLLSRDFLLIGTMNAAIFFTRTGGRQTIMPFIGAANLGMSTASIGVVFSAMAILNMLLVLPSAYVSDHIGRKWMIVPSGVLVGVSMFLIAWAPSYALFFTAAMLHSVFASLSGPAPVAYAVDISPPGLRGLGLGLFRSGGDVGFMIGPPVVGFIADHMDYESSMYVNGVLMIAVSLLFLLARERRKGDPATAAQPTRAPR
ncbi:MAG: MFS transporter [Chloroflexi bacterium]|nr:MAG: MFS transporter [Chloroflexota bacterium]